MGAIPAMDDVKPAGPEVVISNVEGQIIEGFGGAFTESSAAVYKTTGGGSWCWISAWQGGHRDIGYTDLKQIRNHKVVRCPVIFT